MGYNTTVVILSDAIHELENDKDFGKRLAAAIMKLSIIKPVHIDIGNHCNACQVVETHHMSEHRLILVGGNEGRVISSAGFLPINNGDEELDIQLLRVLARKHNFSLHKKKSKGKAP